MNIFEKIEFFKSKSSKLKYGWGVIAIFMFIFWFVYPTLKDKLATHESDLLNIFEFILVVFWVSYLMQFLRRRKFRFFIITLLILPAFSFSTSEFIDNYTFNFTLFNTCIPLLWLIYNLIIFFIFPHGEFRWMLALASETIKGVEDGYSSRPFPAGKFEYNKEDLLNFADFMERGTIEKIYRQNDKIIMVFNGGLSSYIPFIKPNFEKLTYAEMDFKGNMNIHFAEKDYKLYKEELTFDELCKAFGELIWRFFRYYIDGNPKQILKEFRRVKYC